MNQTRSEIRNLRVLVLAAFLAVAAMVAITASRALGGPSRVDMRVLAAFTAALTAAEYLLIRFRVRDEIVALNLFEAVLAPMIVALPAVWVVAAVAVAQAAAGALRRNRPIKVTFNVAQWSAAAGAATVIARALHAHASASAAAVGTILLALVAVSVVNALSFATVLRIVNHEPVRRSLAGVARSFTLTFGVGASFGMLFLAAYAASAAMIAAFFVPLVFLHYGFRGYASVLADRRRLNGLHRATEALAIPMNPRDGLPRFLDEVRNCFAAERVELLLVGEALHITDQSGSHALSDVAYSPVACALANRATGAHITAGQDDTIANVLRAGGYRDCLAAPLMSGAQLTGMLCVYDRGGVEGNLDGERAVLDALARAAAAAVQKSALLEEILEERRKLADIVEYASDGILTAAADGTILTWNPAFAAVTGFGTGQMVGAHSLAALRPRDEYGSDVLLERWAENVDALPANLLVTTPQGEVRSLGCSYTVVPGPDGSPAQLILVARDTTRIREVERLREDFVAAVSHELRTPLTPIKGFAATLLERGDSLDRHQREGAIRSIARQADRLERLITNLLEMTKVERNVGTVNQGTVDAASAVAKVVGDTRAMNADREIRLTVPVEGAVVRGDSLWIEQIASNLLSNALKYSPADTPVEIVVATRGEVVEVSVEDAGLGIAPADRERVFERFRRLSDDVTRSTGGAGIGLYISRYLARSMEGDLVVASSSHGTKLLLTLRNARVLAAVV